MRRKSPPSWRRQRHADVILTSAQHCPRVGPSADDPSRVGPSTQSCPGCPPPPPNRRYHKDSWTSRCGCQRWRRQREAKSAARGAGTRKAARHRLHHPIRVACSKAGSFGEGGNSWRRPHLPCTPLRSKFPYLGQDSSSRLLKQSRKPKPAIYMVLFTEHTILLRCLSKHFCQLHSLRRLLKMNTGAKF